MVQNTRPDQSLNCFIIFTCRNTIFRYIGHSPFKQFSYVFWAQKGAPACQRLVHIHLTLQREKCELGVVLATFLNRVPATVPLRYPNDVYCPTVVVNSSQPATMEAVNACTQFSIRMAGRGVVKEARTGIAVDKNPDCLHRRYCHWR